MHIHFWKTFISFLVYHFVCLGAIINLNRNILLDFFVLTTHGKLLSFVSRIFE